MKKALVYCLILLSVFACKSKEKSESAEFFKRANYHFRKNELDKALGFFNEAIEKTPDFSDAYNNRGVLYLKLDKVKEAQADFEKALSLDPEFDQAKYNLAKLYSETGNTEASGDLFKQIAKVYKDSSDYHNYYGQNWVRMNKNTDALESFGVAVRLNPKNVEALTNMGYVYFLQNDLKVAKDYLNKALSIQPGFGYALNNLAVISEKEHDLEKAIKLTQKALDSDKNSIIYLNNLSLFSFLNNDEKRGNEYLQKALKLDDSNPYTLRNKAISLYVNNDFASAGSILKEIEAKSPEVDYVYYYLGMVSLKLNEKENACRYFKTGEKLNDGKSADELKGCN